jgi:hypothetical protein
MTRKGETEARRIQRWWPHHVALFAEAVRGVTNLPLYEAAKEMGGAPQPYYLIRDGRELVVFCFTTAEAAQAFAQRFGGEMLSVEEPRRRR